MKCRNFLDPTSVFKGETEETLLKLSKALEITEYFKSQYEEYRTKVPTYFKEGKTPRDWEFAPVFAFARYDAYTNRLKTIKVC